MDYFKQLAQKFPQPLDPNIQEQLLKEYYNSSYKYCFNWAAIVDSCAAY